MRAQSLAQVMRLVRDTSGYNQTKLGKEIGADQGSVSRFINGKQGASFNHVLEMLSRVGWELHMARKPKKDDSVKRRDFIASAATVMLVPSACPSGEPYRDAEYVEALAARMSGTLFELGGVSSVDAARRHLVCIRPALTGKDRKLQSAASELARKTMLVLYDAQRLGHAEQAGGLALEFARIAGDNAAQTDALRNLSMISAFQGKGHRGAMYAQNALKVPEITDEQRAQALTCLGRSLGMVSGHERKARTILDQARGIDNLSPFEQADLLGGVGVALKEQREYTRANETLNEAVALMERISPLLQANYLARQVQSALCIGDPSMAAELMKPLASAAPLVSSARLDGYLTEIMTASARWATVPEMRDARTRLKAVMAPSASA